MPSVYDIKRIESNRNLTILPEEKDAAIRLVEIIRSPGYSFVRFSELAGNLKVGKQDASEIAVTDTVRAQKSNFSFVLEETGDRELFEECLVAEGRLFTDYRACIAGSRRILEVLASYYFSKLLVKFGLTESEERGRIIAKSLEKIGDMKSDFNVRGQLKICLAALGFMKIVNYSGKNKNIRYTCISLIPKYDLGQELIESVYQNASYYADHVNEKAPYPLCIEIMRKLYILFKLLFEQEHINGNLSAAGINRLSHFQERQAPFYAGGIYYYPLEKEVMKRLGIKTADEDRIFISEGEQIRFYLFKKEKEAGTSANRDIEALIRLWDHSKDFPENVLRDMGDIGLDDHRYRIFAFNSAPRTMDAEFVDTLTLEEKGQIIDGMLKSIRTLHHFNPPMPHRWLTPDSYYVCRTDDSYYAVLKTFATVKDFTEGAETIHMDERKGKETLRNRMCIAPEIIEGKTDSDQLTKADIYSLGKLMIYIYTGRVEAAAADESIPDVYRSMIVSMTQEEPSGRPDIDTVIRQFEYQGSAKPEIYITMNKSKRRSQEDAVLFGDSIICEDRFDKMVPGGVPTLLGVFDGMGGETAGKEIASLAAETVKENMKPFLKAELNDYMHQLRNAIDEAEYAVRSFKKENGISSGGAAMVLAVVTEDIVFFSNVGDSRCYLVHNGTINQLSEDHRLPAIGNRKGELYQYIGVTNDEENLSPCIGRIPFYENDVLILCSDGISDHVSTEEMLSTLLKAKDIEEAGEKILSEVLQHGGRDNATIILYRRQ